MRPMSPTNVQITSNNIQVMVESHKEKRTKGVLVPAGRKHQLSCLDDLNIPAPDHFGSQPPLDYGFCFNNHESAESSPRLPKKHHPQTGSISASGTLR
ncbi:dynein heavy chain 2, axonemal-like [Perca fluviatilis]|uniref:dynein heavy chain 2, axonemal-like n=1 Tax=Perca fluviatilis TaxID=8168 RepID=UPI00196259AB|nr:dynein heavy chain 2, axonemal-like [Perca fluviatilis]